MRTTPFSLELPLRSPDPRAVHGRPATPGSRNCSPQTGRSDRILNVSKVASISSTGAPGIGHYEKVAVMTSGRHADAAIPSVGGHFGPDLLHIISPARGLAACTPRADRCRASARRRSTSAQWRCAVDEPTLHVARGVGTARVAKRSVELMSSSGTPRYLAHEA